MRAERRVLFKKAFVFDLCLNIEVHSINKKQWHSDEKS